METKNLHDSIFGFAHQLLGMVLDTISQADGHVRNEIESDISLRQSIEYEGSNFASLLSNRFKIVALACVDTFNGKQSQIKARPSGPIIEQEEEECEDTPVAEDEEETPTMEQILNTNGTESEDDREASTDMD